MKLFGKGPYGFRKTPYASVNKLAEWLDLPGAASKRRRQLLQRLKYPPKGIVAWYAEARTAIAAFLVHGSLDKLQAEAKQLARDKSGTEHQVKLRVASATAIRRFSDLVEAAELEFDNLEVRVYREPWLELPKLTIEGVSVSVAPEAKLTGHWRGKPVLGFVKLHSVKKHVLSDYAGSCAANILEQFGNEHFDGEATVSRRHCIVVDLFNRDQRVFRAPSSFKKRQEEIAEACAEIARQWDNIEPPKDYVAA